MTTRTIQSDTVQTATMRHVMQLVCAWSFLLNGFVFNVHFFAGLYTMHLIKSKSEAQIFWNIIDFGSDRRLIGYFVYYIEAPLQNINYFTGLDACSQ